MVKTPSSNSCQRKLNITDVQAPLQDGKGFLEGQDEARQHQSSPRLPGPAEALQVNGVHHRPQQRPAQNVPTILCLRTDEENLKTAFIAPVGWMENEIKQNRIV